MPRSCSVCSHPQRAMLEQALAGAASLRDVAQRFGVSKTAAGRHWLLHGNESGQAREDGQEGDSMTKKKTNADTHAEQSPPQGSLALAKAEVAAAEAEVEAALMQVGGVENERRAVEREVARLEIQVSQAMGEEAGELARKLAAKRRAFADIDAAWFEVVSRVQKPAQFKLAQAREQAVRLAELTRVAASEVAHFQESVTAAKARLADVERAVEIELSLTQPRLDAARKRLALFTGGGE